MSSDSRAALTAALRVQHPFACYFVAIHG